MQYEKDNGQGRANKDGKKYVIINNFFSNNLEKKFMYFSTIT